ncbi:hypothetical protein [Dyadobacter sp. CY323]|uniref:hypothetical protein n=1 Tax=Dyadobacter sp. CY323 TaxID=2907302 RepID=UPI001F341E03|nr:hypothetical protein [Dyadobacter sp. CY323]MCE6992121.1 hypothetical protein [Dyadobacter sp. CY323]
MNFVSLRMPIQNHRKITMHSPEEDPSKIKEFGYLTIKERLIKRFVVARDVLGKHWRDELAESDPFFNTKLGADFMGSVSQAISDTSRGHVDRIERVVVAMEKLAGIKITRVV